MVAWFIAGLVEEGLTLSSVLTGSKASISKTADSQASNELPSNAWYRASNLVIFFVMHTALFYLLLSSCRHSSSCTLAVLKLPTLSSVELESFNSSSALNVHSSHIPLSYTLTLLATSDAIQSLPHGLCSPALILCNDSSDSCHQICRLQIVVRRLVGASRVYWLVGPPIHSSTHFMCRLYKSADPQLYGSTHLQ